MATLPPGPFETLDVGGGVTAPVYLIPFDKRGRVKAPQTRAHLIDAATQGGFTHLFLFSHGWNNDFETALGRYRRFFSEFKGVREQHSGPADYRPLLVGVIWPSTALVLPWERPPKMAGAPGPDAALDRAQEADAYLEELDDVADSLPAESVARFFELATSSEPLDEAAATELATLLQPLYAAPDDPGAAAEGAPSAEEILATWQVVAQTTSPTRPAADDEDEEAFGGGALDGAGDAGGPEAAGFFSFLDPRPALRSFTVWKMKDRAGVVGSRGVGPLLADLLAAAPAAKCHLIGHSYGAKVVLSAANTLPDGSTVTSALLLQPAINGFAFAANVANEGFPGGYRRVLSIVQQPILSTFSKHDAPLTKLFHLAVRRRGDLGEVRVAAGAPSRYAALGGFGPRGTPPPEGVEISMPAAGTAYPSLDAGTEIVGLQGDALIDGHGDVTTPHTAWALLHQVLGA